VVVSVEWLTTVQETQYLAPEYVLLGDTLDYWPSCVCGVWCVVCSPIIYQETDERGEGLTRGVVILN